MPTFIGMVKILPQLFYETPEVKKIFVDGLSCIVYKKLDNAVWHKEGYVSTHAITLVLKGLLRAENDDGLFTEVPAGHMIFLPKGLYNISDIIPQNGSFEAVVFFFERDVIEQFLQSLNCQCSREKSLSHFPLRYGKTVQVFTESLLQMYGDRERPIRQLTKTKLFEFLHLIHASYNGDNCFAIALSTLNNKERKSLKEFMHANFSKPLSIEDYAYLTGRSLSTFRRDFKAQFSGISPKQWLIERRLEKAYHLLSTKPITVSEVVQEIGYENMPHFIKAFRDKYGLPPKQFLIQKRQAALV